MLYENFRTPRKYKKLLVQQGFGDVDADITASQWSTYTYHGTPEWDTYPLDILISSGYTKHAEVLIQNKAHHFSQVAQLLNMMNKNKKC